MWDLEPSNQVNQSLALAELWHELCAGRIFISQTHCTLGRCYARMETRRGEALETEQIRMLERVFSGESQKSLACDLRVSVATIAGRCNLSLGRMLRGHRVSRAPILLVMASLAAAGVELADARVESRHDDGSWVVSVEVPGTTFEGRISPSELAVALLSIEGSSHTDVARRRARSTRTVANQLASLFEKLRVSGRGELRAKAIRELASVRALQRPATTVEARPGAACGGVG